MENRINKRKFCFIICVNNEGYLEECLWYIDRISVPDGYEKEHVVIRDAKSMTSGYNQAMKLTDAKYKIYIHQDVLLVNVNLLSQLLTAFEDPSVGMVGVLGKREFILSAEYSEHWDTGAVEVCNGTNAIYFNFSPEAKGWTGVRAIDGMFMATQYDIPWDEEHFDGWDFYDISQCEQFRRGGYRIVVPGIPSLEENWAFHDAGQCEYDGWEHYRRIFCEEYEDQGYHYMTAEWVKHRDEIREKQNQIMNVFSANDFNKAGEMLMQLEAGEMNSQLAQVACYLVIMGEEMSAYGGIVSSVLQEFDEFVREYEQVKFALRRFYFEERSGAWASLQNRLRAGKISMKFLWVAAHESVADPNRLWWRVFAEYQKEIRELMKQGEILEAERLLQQMDEKWRGRDGNIFLILIYVFRREVESGMQRTVFDRFADPDDMIQHFIRLKLYLRRIEFGLAQEYQREVYDYFVQTNVSEYLIFQILQKNIFYKEQFCRNLSLLFEREEGTDSMRSKLYRQLAEQE